MLRSFDRNYIQISSPPHDDSGVSALNPFGDREHREAVPAEFTLGDGGERRACVTPDDPDADGRRSLSHRRRRFAWNISLARFVTLFFSLSSSRSLFIAMLRRPEAVRRERGRLLLDGRLQSLIVGCQLGGGGTRNSPLEGIAIAEEAEGVSATGRTRAEPGRRRRLGGDLDQEQRRALCFAYASGTGTPQLHAPAINYIRIAGVARVEHDRVFEALELNVP